ncbi:MAG TPA: amino acid adenylation domain-containing protein [Streptosporangiaceae bacterium]|nr:amino acid adenylation domain-containing protein [Streptosporangiaceae bacterium]
MRTVWDAVQAQAQRAPLAAAACGERDYTYRELTERAAEISRVIRALADPGAVVALEAATPAAGAIAILGAAKSGCPVLLLSPDSPPARREDMLADASPAVLLREAGDDMFTAEPLTASDSLPDGASLPRWDLRDVAYIIYTSGLTGRPKGVVVPHDALLSQLEALACVPGFGPADSFLAMSALTFDICLAELFLPLITGGRFVAAPPAARLDPEIFDRVVRASGPDVIQATPSFWRLALAWGWRAGTGRRLWSGGEILTPGLARKLLGAGAELWNVYGPTETTIWTTAARITAAGSISLGDPLPGSGLCLEDGDGKLVSEPGCPGEILLYGAGVALGYLNRPELTAERFRVCDTFDGPRRCYRTGDQAQYTSDGSLRFLGRTDGQIKLRGWRIELGEIEAVMEEHPAVQQAAAVLRDAGDPGRAHIALFVVAGPELTVRQIRGWMSERVPAGMRPGRIMIRPALPRTTSGKVDRVRLASEPVTRSSAGL